MHCNIHFFCLSYISTTPFAVLGQPCIPVYLTVAWQHQQVTWLLSMWSHDASETVKLHGHDHMTNFLHANCSVLFLCIWPFKNFSKFPFGKDKQFCQNLIQEACKDARVLFTIFMSSSLVWLVPGHNKLYLLTPYLLRALSISMTTRTERAIVMGAGWSNTSQSTPKKRSSCARHWEWWVYTMGDNSA